MMNGTRLDTLAKPSSSGGNGCLSRIVKLWSSRPSSRPAPRRAPGRADPAPSSAAAMQHNRHREPAGRRGIEPRAQGEAVDELVRRNTVIADHLRLRLELRVQGEQ